MAGIVGQVERVVDIDVDAVRARKLALAPRAQEIAFAIEHDDRMLAAVERVDAVLAVDRDRRDVLELPAFGKLCPVLDDSIAVLAAPQDRCHGRAGYEA